MTAQGTAFGVVLSGVVGELVRVEADVADGLPGVTIVGLPDTSVSESRQRIKVAIERLDMAWPNRRLTIGLSPAELRKHGSGLDLPMAMAVLAATDQLGGASLGSTAFIGELGLDGRLLVPRGALASALAARRAGLGRVVVPSAAAEQLCRLTGIEVVVADDLATVVAVVVGSRPPVLAGTAPTSGVPEAEGPDLRDVRGHAQGRLALEVAAAGGHHVAFVGSPGVGKTLLADRLAGILPDLDDEAALDVASVHSVAGSPRPDALYRRPPAQSPHHSASAAALLGAVHGVHVAPGAATLAHRGVLVLDEAAELSRPALEGLRQPLESGWISLARSAWRGRLPARFQLVLAANPCPCGRRTGSGIGCTCPSTAIRRYAAKLSGPLLDRIDIRLELARPTDAELATGAEGESSVAVRDRVRAAQERGAHRRAGTPWRSNAQVPTGVLRRRWRPDAEGAELLASIERGSANLRGPDRVLRMAWTVADLAGRDVPGYDDVALAMSLRGASLPWAA